MEGSVAVTVMAAPAVVGCDISSSGRTWKMIKGKVSQTIEDIKSAKTANSSNNSNTAAGTGLNNTNNNNSTPLSNVILKGEQHFSLNETESDIEKNHSIGDDLSVKDQEVRTKRNGSFVNIASGSEGATIKLIKRHHKLEDSDTDFETEIFFEGDWEPSKLRRGFETLKSRVKTKHSQHSQQQHPLPSSTHLSAHSAKKEANLSRSTGSLPSSSLRGTFLRVRRNKVAEMSDLPPTLPANLTAAAAVASGEMAASLPVVVSGKSDKQTLQTSLPAKKEHSEIESGVEMFEDMIPPAAASGNLSTAKLSSSDLSKLPNVQDDYRSLIESYIGESKQQSATSIDNTMQSTAEQAIDDNIHEPNPQIVNNLYSFKDLCREIYQSIRCMPVLSTLALLVVLMLPIQDFIRGILATILFMAIMESFCNFITSVISYYLLTYRPQNVNFEIPDYTKMSICEIPAAKEYQTVKSYEGWMNEIDNYDLNTFHVSMTKSVYVKLEGTVLHISNTNARIPKRVLWNEAPIDLKTIIFTSHRTYTLLGCRIDLLPLGLAKKRHFNRKYPIQLIVKECIDPDKSSIASKIKRKMKITKQEKNTTEKLSASEPSGTEMDFATTVLKADLQKLQDDINPDEGLKSMTVPCANEVRLLLFARAAREKEDWYRRFVAASVGDIIDHDFHIDNIRLIDDNDLQAAAAAAQTIINSPNIPLHTSSSTKIKEFGSDHTQDAQPSTSVQKDTTDDVANEHFTEKVNEVENEDGFIDLVEEEDKETIEGLIMASCAARNDRDYIRFMSLYQKACRQSRIPVYRSGTYQENPTKKYRKRLPRQGDDLWKGIDQTLFLGPSGSVVWLNVLMGRLIYSILQNNDLLEKITHSFQKKLNAIKLPSFMEDVIIKDIDFGNTPFLVHRVSQPLIDERGVWLDADVTYEGLCHITVTTKLNLLRLKRPARSTIVMESTQGASPQPFNPRITVTLNDEAGAVRRGQDDELIYLTPSGSAIYDSDAESTGSSESEAEDHVTGAVNENATNDNSSAPGNARRIFKFVDRLTTSHLFQYATEISYVQRAMENMITNITLGIDIRGLVSRVTLNIPPPPSDRVWIAFRAPPRLWLSARPTVGDKSVDWTIVTNIIEGKLCEAVNKYLVYPNMVDVTIPFLGKPYPTETI